MSTILQTFTVLLCADMRDVDLRAMSQVIRITFLTSILCGALLLFLLIKRANDDREAFIIETGSTTTVELNERVNKTFRRRYMTTDEMQYILFGIGGQFSPYDQQIIDYIGSHILQPSLKRPRRLQSPGSIDSSQHGQSAFIDKLLSGRRNGFFVECGAYDGEFLSNSLFFELHRNWTGLLIEADPVYYRALLTKNRRAYLLLACLSNKARPAVLQMQRPDGEEYAGHSGIIDRTDQPQLGFVGDHNAHTVFEVNCFPLNSIMAALRVSHVDYLSLDVEGPELEILHTVDWSRLHIDVITVEYRNTGIPDKVATLKKLNDLRQFFRNTGIYREEALIPKGSEADGLDVVFSRFDSTSNARG